MFIIWAIIIIIIIVIVTVIIIIIIIIIATSIHCWWLHTATIASNAVEVQPDLDVWRSNVRQAEVRKAS